MLRPRLLIDCSLVWGIRLVYWVIKLVANGCAARDIILTLFFSAIASYHTIRSRAFL